MPSFRVMGTLLIESTGDEATYEVIIDRIDSPPDPITVLEYLVKTGDIQIIPAAWEEVDENGIGV